MKNAWLLLAAFSFLVSMTSPACSEDKNLNIVFIPKSSDQDFWIFMRDGVDKAVREAGNVTLTWRGPRYNDDTDSQISIVQAYTRPGVDALIIAPTDRERLVESVRKAAELGIKIIVVDSAVDGNYHQNFITTDNFSGGKLAAKRLSDLLNGQGNVVVYRTVVGSASTDDRANGFVEYLKEKSPKMTIVADEYGGGSKGKSLRSATALLKRLPQVDGIFAVNESSSDGMLRALRSGGLAGQVKFVGFDATKFLLEGLENKEINGLVVQNPRQMGYLAMKAAVAAINGAPIADRAVFTDTTLVSPDNFQDPEIRSLLVP